MARHPRPDVIEIWVEALEDVTARRSGQRPTTAPSPPRPAPIGGSTVGPVAARMPNPATHPLKGLSASFRRLVEVSGDAVPRAQFAYVDRHLVLEPPRLVGISWAWRGRLRRTVASRWIPIELILTPYTKRFTLLELIPRRRVRVGRRWFSNGHDSIDRFVADLHRSVGGQGSDRPALG
jgi:hypothetical protein